MNVVDASGVFAVRRWCPAKFVKARGMDPLIFADSCTAMPLSTLPVEAGMALVRIINALERVVPATRAFVALTWRDASSIEVHYDRACVELLKLEEPPIGVEVTVCGEVVCASFSAASPNDLLPGAA